MKRAVIGHPSSTVQHFPGKQLFANRHSVADLILLRVEVT